MTPGFQYQPLGQAPSMMRPAAAPVAGPYNPASFLVPDPGPLYSQPAEMQTNWMEQFTNPMGANNIPRPGANYVPGMTVPGMGTPNGEQSWMGQIGDMIKSSGVMGSTDKNGAKTDGWGSLALGAAQGLASTYMGMKQYGLAKETLAENKKQFGLNYEAQKTTTNASLEDRQRARVASNSGAYESVGSYMNKNGIK